MSSVAGRASMTSYDKTTWNRSELKRLMVRAFTEGKGEDTQLHQSLIRLGIVTKDQCKDLIAALGEADDIWKPLHRAFNAAHVTRTRGLYRLFPWLSKRGHHKRAGALTVDEFRAVAIGVIAHIYGLSGKSAPDRGTTFTMKAITAASRRSRSGPRLASCSDYERACMTHGESEAPIYALAAAVVETTGLRGETVVDVGCGRGAAWNYLKPFYAQYTGVDLVAYDGFPAEGRFVKANLNTDRIGLPDATADLVVSIETIEHLENPRAFARELVRLAKPGAFTHTA